MSSNLADSVNNSQPVALNSNPWPKPVAVPVPAPEGERMVSVPVTVILAAQALVGLPPTGKWDEQTLEALRTYVANNVLSTEGWTEAWRDAFANIQSALRHLPVTPDERVAWLSDLHRTVSEQV